MVATAPVREIGYAQNTAYGGYWWMYEDEQTPELVWPQSVFVFDAMRRTDAQCASVLRAVTLPVRRTPWRIDPNGARDEVVELVATDLGLPIVGAEAPKAPPRMRDRFSWPEHLRQALLMLPFGHSFFEITFRVDKDGNRAHLHKLSPRPAKTIERIEVARDGGLLWIKQYPAGPGGHGDSQEPIPVNRLVAYVHDREGGNWLGTSILRSGYKNWLLKDRLLRVQAQTIERNGMGIPLYKAQEGATEADITAGKEMAKAWRAGEAAGSAIPFGADLVLRGVEGDLPDANPVIRYHDEQLARAVLAHFLNLDTQSHGSYALGSSFMDFFTLSLQTLGMQVADTATMHVIEDLVDVNWGEDEPAPRLVFDEIGSRQAATAQAIKLLIEAGIIHPDEVLEESERQRYGLPPRDPATAQAAEDEADVDSDAMVAAIDAYQNGGRVAAAAGPDFNRLHPRGSKGRFRDTFSRILDGLTKWAAAGGKGDPFEGFEREPLRRTAVARGITLKRGASRDDIADALLGHLREALGGEGDGSDEKPEPEAKKPAKKAAPKKGAESPEDVAAKLGAAKTREEAQEILDGRSGAELKDIAKATGTYIGGSGSKSAMTTQIVEHTVGFRLNSRTIRNTDLSTPASREADRLDREAADVPDATPRKRTPAKKAVPAARSTTSAAKRELDAEEADERADGLYVPPRHPAMNTPYAAGKELDRSHSQDQADDALEGLTLPELREVARDKGVTVSGRDAESVRRQIVEGLTPKRPDWPPTWERNPRAVDHVLLQLARVDWTATEGVPADPAQGLIDHLSLREHKELARRIGLPDGGLKSKPEWHDAIVAAFMRGDVPSSALADVAPERGPDLVIARERQDAIDSARRYADTAAELEELIHNEATDEALLHRLDAATARHGHADDFADVRHVLEQGERDRARFELILALKKRGIERDQSPGESARFTPGVHQPIDGSLREGQPVEVVRPGFTLTLPGSVDPARAREVEVENKIRAAYRDVLTVPAPNGATRRSGSYLHLADVRERLSDLSREDQDTALVRMLRRGEIGLAPQEHRLPGRGGQRDKDARLPLPWYGTGSPADMLVIDDPSDRPLGRDGETIRVRKAVVEAADGAPGAPGGPFTGDAALGLTAVPLRSEAERAAFRDWAGGYVGVNATLRDGHGSIAGGSARDRRIAAGLDRALARSPLSGDITVTRGIDELGPLGIGDPTPGAEWTDHGFNSTAAKRPQGITGIRPGGAQMRITVPAGVHAVSGPGLDPDEILLDRGLRYRVTRAEMGPDGVWRLDVDVVPTDAPEPDTDPEALRDALDLKTVDQLKDMIRERNKTTGSKLKVSGRKRELVDRLVGDLRPGDSPTAPEPSRKRAPRRETGRAPATPVPIHDLMDADDATIEAALRDVYEGQFGPYTTKVTRVGIRRAGTDSRGRPVEAEIFVEGSIFGPDGPSGGSIGNFGRSIGPATLHYGDTVRREIWAQHSVVEIEPEFQGKGFGGAFNGRVIAWYRASGVHGISQDDHNFYTWASQGFGFRGGIVPDYLVDTMRTLIADLRAGKTKTKFGETIPKRLRDAPDIDAQIAAAEAVLARLESTSPGDPGYPTAYEISQLGRRPGQRGKTALWFGKHLPVSADELILNPDEGEVISG